MSTRTVKAITEELCGQSFSAQPGNKAAAMGLLSEQAQSSYGPVFDALMPFMPQIVSEWSEPRRISGSDNIAEYAVVRTTDGVQRIYMFSFVRDESGNWLIDSM